MSPLTAAMRISRAPSKTRGQSRQPGRAKASRQNQRPSARPDHSAMKVAMATPFTPQPKPSTKTKFEHDVQPVHPELEDQNRPRALLRDEPAGDAVDRDGRRRRPDADRHVAAGRALSTSAVAGETAKAAQRIGPWRSDQRQAARPRRSSGRATGSPSPRPGRPRRWPGSPGRPCPCAESRRPSRRPSVR